jgi:LysM repeat protein
VTIAVVVFHSLRDKGTPVPASSSKPHAAVAPAGPRAYRVRAGDTLGAIAARTGIPINRILRLNPKLQPTSLFIGQRIRLR